MLIFFIHGVATRDAGYGNNLKELLKKEFTKREEPHPHFHSSFWGDVLRDDVDKMWHWIDQDLQAFRKKEPQVDLQDLFRYQKFRQGLMSDFVGDVFTYLNPERGVKIRKLIAEHLYDFLKKNPEETELHIVAHSLGSVILWDILFSTRFNPKDPAFYIRAMINGLSESSSFKKVNLKSISTMGSPILFLNTMLDVSPENIKKFASKYQEEHLRWINIIHSSDILAYPLQASLNLDSSDSLSFQDKYIQADANPAERAVRNFVNSVQKLVDAVSQFNAAIKEGVGHAPMVAGVSDAHTGYWNCNRTASLITSNILNPDTTSPPDLIKEVILRLQQVPGMAKNSIPEPITIKNPFDTILESLNFKDGSGKLFLTTNPFKVLQVYVLKHEDIKFSGHVGWIHSDGLKEAVELIKRDFC